MMAAVRARPSIQIFGHRGAGCSVVGGGSAVPENSFAAFERAAALGLDGVELDVWLTKDEQVIVVHGGGSDLDGYLYETVVDVGFRREVYQRERKMKKKRHSSKAAQPPQEQNDTSSTYSYQSGISDAATEKSLTGSSSTTSCEVDDVVVEIDGECRLRRIEEIVYSDLQRAGELKLREPWTVFRNRQCVAKAQIQDDDDSNAWCHSTAATIPDGSTLSLFETSGCMRIEVQTAATTPVSQEKAALAKDSETDDSSPIAITVPVPSNIESPVLMHMLSFERPIGSAVKSREFHQLTTLEKENETFDYHENLSAFVDSDNIVSEVPLLAEVFRRFHGRLRFNVELKGTNPRLGRMVLDLARPYPGIIARISSFLWGIDGVVYGNPKLPWGDVDGPCDLLLPIMHNSDGIPIALLFGGYRQPSVAKILQALRHYQSEWIHLPQVGIVSSFRVLGVHHVSMLQSFILSDPADATAASALRDELRSIPGVVALLDSFPSAVLSQINMKNSETANHDNDDDVEEEECLLHPTRDSVERECVHLYYLTRELHKRGHKVLVYGGRADEVTALLELSLLCGVDGLCPNNVSLAFAVSRDFLQGRGTMAFNMLE